MSKEADTAAAAPPVEERSHSYRRILSATSMLGGATAVNLLVGMVRSKAVALLLGPTGVGIIGTYQSLTTMVATIASMGLNMSGVREVAAAKGSDNKERLADTLATFRRMTLVLAIAGAAVLMVFAGPFSSLTFENTGHTQAIVFLSGVVFFSVMISYNTAVIQGWHHIGKVAKLSVVSSVIGAAISIGLFWQLGSKGIVPALIAGGAVQWLLSTIYTRELGVPAAINGGKWSKDAAGNLLKIGGLFVFFGIASSAAAYFQRLIVVRGLGEVAAGMFQAASALSVIYASYVLNSMSTDFLPRLSAVAEDSDQVNKLVNEQTVVAVLLALPGIVATNVFAHLAILVFYSPAFKPAILVLQLLAAGVFGKIVSWPPGIVLVARRRVKLNLILETLYHGVFFATLIATQPVLGLNASGLAPIVTSVVHTTILFLVVRRETGFSWDARSRKVLLIGIATVTGSLAGSMLLPPIAGWVVGGLLLVFTCWFSYSTLSVAADLTLASAFAKVFRVKRKAA